jgi:hypothetical protein
VTRDELDAQVLSIVRAAPEDWWYTADTAQRMLVERSGVEDISIKRVAMSLSRLAKRGEIERNTTPGHFMYRAPR